MPCQIIHSPPSPANLKPVLEIRVEVCHCLSSHSQLLQFEHVVQLSAGGPGPLSEPLNRSSRDSGSELDSVESEGDLCRGRSGPEFQDRTSRLPAAAGGIQSP